MLYPEIYNFLVKALHINIDVTKEYLGAQVEVKPFSRGEIKRLMKYRGT